MLNWCATFNICAFLDNHAYQLPGHRYECLAGCGVHQQVSVTGINALEQLQQFLNSTNDWCFGHLSYDLWHQLEQCGAAPPDPAGFPLLTFFVPQYVLQLSDEALVIASLAADHTQVWEAIVNTAATKAPQQQVTQVQERVSKQQYLETVQALQRHILRGDCYEINYCIGFDASPVSIEPVLVYQRLSALSPNPFSAFYRVEDAFLLCASPERFLRRQGNQLLSQPIKGTWKRNQLSAAADAAHKEALFNSAKDRSENVMVVDLVRNDLSRVCVQGTVQVDELFGIYTFPQVHQMISTISGRVDTQLSFTDVIKATFPMGSMTGAPKRKVMELIQRYETTGRGLFSGAVGYINPEGDFDFNVVIRSIFYNQASGACSFLVGSGITHYSNPEAEYEECLLKAAAMQQALAAASTV